MFPKRTSRNVIAVSLAFLWALASAPQEARAVPTLQLYIDGSTYDTVSDTWVISGSNSFTLWVLGDVGKYGNIYDVKLAAAVQTSETGTGAISLTPTTAGLLTDPSTPSVPGANGLSADGAVPVLGDGSALATHGIYGTGTSFYEWTLGDFNLTDSAIGDFQYSFPDSFPSSGQINAYAVTVSGFTTVHFDAYDHVVKNDTHVRYKFAPFSHDGAVSPIPEPEVYAMLVAGLGLMGFVARRRRESKP